MAIIYTCSFDHYGPATGTTDQIVGQWPIGDDVLLGDGWADIPRAPVAQTRAFGTYDIVAPAWGARAGDYALSTDANTYKLAGLGTGDRTRSPLECLRLTIPGSSQTTRLIHFAFSISSLPATDRRQGYICHFLDSDGLIRGSLYVTPSGRLGLVDGGNITADSGGAFTSLPTSLLTSSAPVIFPETWYYFSIQITTNATDATADVDVYLGDITPANKVLSGTSLAFTDTDAGATTKNNIDMLGFLPASWSAGSELTDDPATRAIRDIVICDTSGSYNNTLLGQCFVSAQEMRTEDVGGGWAANSRENVGDGVLDHVTNRTGLRAADAAALEIGTSNFTVETFTRFHALPDSVSTANIIAKWRTDTSNRSYRLVYYGSDNTIRWEISTDGVTTTTIKRIPWQPSLDTWYHLAVVRSSNQTLLFIDGVQFGVPVADANTYYDSSAPLGIGARFNGTTTLVTDSTFNGWLDETRITIGVARYTSDFTPTTTRFGRNVSDDASFASVVLLLGFDGLSLTDESSYARTISTTAPAVTAIQPDDSANKYNVLNNRPPIDDTYIEAAQTYAEGYFTFEDIPTASETMTVGSETYTWVSALSTVGPNEVLIGADIDECINNIVAAINDSGGEGTIYGNGTDPNADAQADTFQTPQFVVRATAVGAAGNSVATTDTMADGYFGATTLEGGQDIPADSDFAIERLPSDVTGILGIQMTVRHYKTDAGSATVRYDFKGPAGAVAAGTGLSPDLNPAWERQIFEEDPDTSAGLTPSSLIGGRMRFKRTV